MHFYDIVITINFRKECMVKNIIQKIEMKSEKGMTLITTAVLVIVIAALVFAVVYYARIELAKQNLENIKTDMLLVQAKVKGVASNYTLDKKEEDFKGTKIAEMKEQESIKKFLEATKIDIEEKDKKYYALNEQNLAELNLNKLKLEENEYYIVEYTSNEVYYTKGITYTDGNTYYNITDIEELTVDNMK